MSCDLLSFYYLCRTGNNRRAGAGQGLRVVICFHFTIFVVLETTSPKSYGRQAGCDLLSFYYLCRTGNNFETKQHYYDSSCDLLSFYYLCRTGNNTLRSLFNFTLVVICFHFTIFVVLETTNSSDALREASL